MFVHCLVVSEIQEGKSHTQINLRIYGESIRVSIKQYGNNVIFQGKETFSTKVTFEEK